MTQAHRAEKIFFSNQKMVVPDHPVIPFIEGDGTGPDIWKATQRVVDAAISKTFGQKRSIVWKPILAGEKAFRETGEWLPSSTLEAIREYCVAIKGPLTTPVGGGFRSINVSLRMELDLYACIRPVRYFEGVPSPMRAPEKIKMVVFRENTEDVYSGIEWKANTAEAGKVIRFLNEEMKCRIREGSGIGVKPMSRLASQRLVRRAIQWALDHHLPSVTLVHKGNIMKYTEGAFREWGYELAREEFADRIMTEEDLNQGKSSSGKVILKDRIADNMFQQALLRPEEYSVLATPNLNGDYLSDAITAQVGGLGISPGANIGDKAAVFEATHGTAPKYAGLDKVNPTSLILSGVMMLEHMGWQPAADAIVRALEKTIQSRTVTYDFARLMKDAREVRCSEFGSAVIHHLESEGAS